MTRTFALLAAALAIAAPAAAATYAGKPAVAANQTRFVARDIVWNLAGGTYQGQTSESRPVILCQSLAKKVGRLDSFAVDGRAIADADLTKCNSVAPAATAGAVAEAN